MQLQPSHNLHLYNESTIFLGNDVDFGPSKFRGKLVLHCIIEYQGRVEMFAREGYLFTLVQNDLDLYKARGGRRFTCSNPLLYGIFEEIESVFHLIEYVVMYEYQSPLISAL